MGLLTLTLPLLPLFCFWAEAASSSSALAKRVTLVRLEIELDV
jgi:hypothetical protein